VALPSWDALAVAVNPFAVMVGDTGGAVQLDTIKTRVESPSGFSA
jgi:hypothetical protein